MARIPGIESHQASWWLRLLYNSAAKQVAKVTGAAKLPEALTLTAHRPRLLFATALMEMAQGSFRGTPAKLRALASLAAAARTGCPF